MIIIDFAIIITDLLHDVMQCKVSYSVLLILLVMTNVCLSSCSDVVSCEASALSSAFSIVHCSLSLCPLVSSHVPSFMSPSPAPLPPIPFFIPVPPAPFSTSVPPLVPFSFAAFSAPFDPGASCPRPDPADFNLTHPASSDSSRSSSSKSRSECCHFLEKSHEITEPKTKRILKIR